MPVEKIADFEKELFTFISTKYPEIPKQIKESKQLGDDTQKALTEAIREFKEQFR